jgi:hypothetical protein
MTRVLIPIGRQRRVAVVVSRSAWYGLGIGLLIGAAAWIVIALVALL